MTSVVNLRDFGFPRGKLPDDVARIDRRTQYGNPFVIGSRPGGGEKITREEAIASYRRWIAGRLARQPDFLEPLRGKRLACWCAPEACHGDIIVELLG